MTKRANNLTWKAYRDGESYIIGAAEWQTSARSLTYGITDTWEEGDVAKLIRRAEVTPLARCEELKTHYNTWDRFEDACDAGEYGCAW